MYNRIVFTPYKNGLGGLGLIKQKLKEELGVRVLEVKVEGSRYVQKPRDLIIKWGVNNGGKLGQFASFLRAGVPISEYSTDPRQAQLWLDGGERVLARTVLNGHGGDGIIVIHRGDVIPEAPLYVKYTPKQREFRIHVCDGQIKVREKRRRQGWEELGEGFNKYIRNHDNGWVFCDELREELPDNAMEIASGAVAALGLSFGAVDCGYHNEHGWNVYEVNTAPGCDNATAMWYAEQFQRLMIGGE